MTRRTVILLAVGALVVIGATAGITAWLVGGRSVSATPMTYVQSGACRSGAAGAMADLDKIAAATGPDGTAPMGKLTNFDHPVGALQDFGTPRMDRTVAMHCPQAIVERYWDVEAHFDIANGMYGNECYMSMTDRGCDPSVIHTQMLAAIKAGKVFTDDVNEQHPASAANDAHPEPAAGTINVVGNIRLYKGVETPNGGKGHTGHFCLGSGGFDLYGGTPVTVKDAYGTSVALGELEQGVTMNSICVFNFLVPDMPDKVGVYRLSIGSHGGPAFTLRQYRQDPSALYLTLGF